MIRCRLLLLVAVLTMVIVGCGESTSPENDLVAKLSLSFVEVETWTPLSFEFGVDPMSTESRLGPIDSLVIRYDYDGNGTWDNDFGRLYRANHVRIPNLPSREWTVRCEIKDRFGNQSIARESIQLPEGIPVAPDLFVGELSVSKYQWYRSLIDTITVNTDFYLDLPARFWGDRFLVNALARCFVDGELLSESEIFLAGARNRSMNNLVNPQGPFSFAVPGVHFVETELVLIPPDYEIDETNNRKGQYLVVIDEGD